MGWQIDKANNRDKKRNKKKNGMQMDNRNIFQLEEQKARKGKQK